MSKALKPMPLSLLLLVGTLLCVGDAQAQTSSLAAAPVPLEEARRLTWRRDTRADGVVALRHLAESGPDGANARFELGQVLTWDGSTRAEGIALLRRVTEEQPDRTDAEATLAEVLTWDQSTREEGVGRMRRLLARQPSLGVVRLKLAEALSWNPATRDESESLYREVIRDDDSSVDAVVGLAQVLSWRGRYSESRAAYQLALTREPSGAAAVVGLAQVERWSGRARASLSRLTAPSTRAIETPDALQLRAEAYTQIGRPAQALREYEALLAMQPGDQTALRASRLVRRSLQPTLEFGATASTRSGDAATSKVGTSSVPIGVRFHPGGSDAEVSLNASRASYQNSLGAGREMSLGFGVDMPVGNRVRISGEGAGRQFDQAPRAVTGRAEVMVVPHDRLELRLGVSREQLFSSRLSLSGEEQGGIFYGPSFATEIVTGTTLHPARGWDIWANALNGRTRGQNIQSNSQAKIFAGAGRTVSVGKATVRPGYALAWMSYRLDLAGYPATDLGGDGVHRRGVGGYFSPSRFSNHSARVDVTVPVGGSVLLVGGASVGRQSVRDVGTGARGVMRPSSDDYVGFRIEAGDRVSVRGQIDYQNVAAAFDRTTMRVTIAYGF